MNNQQKHHCNTYPDSVDVLSGGSPRNGCFNWVIENQICAFAEYVFEKMLGDYISYMRRGYFYFSLIIKTLFHNNTNDNAII